MTKKQIKKYTEEILYFLDKDSNKIIVLSFSKKKKRTGVLKDEKGVFYLEIGKDLFDECKENKKTWKMRVEYIVAHEYGHIFHDTNYDTFKQKVDSEYKAERFALNKLKKYFPKAYQIVIEKGREQLKSRKWSTSKREKHYRKAWKKIKEYRIK